MNTTPRPRTEQEEHAANLRITREMEAYFAVRLEEYPGSDYYAVRLARIRRLLTEGLSDA